MKKEDNFCHESLLQRIEQLKVLKAQQEATISRQFSSLVGNINTETILTDSIMGLVTNKETQKKVVNMLTKSGTNYIIEKFLGSNNSIKRYIGAILTEKVSNSFLSSMISKL